MPKWIYKGSRRNIRGRWYYDGNIIENKTRPTNDFLPYKKGKETAIVEDLVPDITEESELREELSKMKMKEIRKIGKQYDVYDTKKSELVDEIIEAKKKRGEL